MESSGGSMTCDNCGSELRENASFCTSCGKTVSEDTSQSTQPEQKPDLVFGMKRKNIVWLVSGIAGFAVILALVIVDPGGESQPATAGGGAPTPAPRVIPTPTLPPPTVRPYNLFQERLAAGAQCRELFDIRNSPLEQSDAVSLMDSQLKSVGCSSGRAFAFRKDLPTPTPTPPTATPVRGNAFFGDGTFRVGVDIQTGTYRAQNGSGFCYWERVSGFGGTFGEIIANGTPQGPAIVTIQRGDAGFTSQGCGTWTK